MLEKSLYVLIVLCVCVFLQHIHVIWSLKNEKFLPLNLDKIDEQNLLYFKVAILLCLIFRLKVLSENMDRRCASSL